MQASDLQPASALAMKLGVKILAYGPPGSGKTPAINTLPRPVMLAVEPGLKSMRNSSVPTFEAYTAERIQEFFVWLFSSPEAAAFDSVAVDSVSQMAEIILTQELKRNKDGRKAFGEMSRKMMEYINGLYFLLNKHVYLIAKMSTFDDGGMIIRRPYFPGQELNVRIPHLFDEILYIANQQVPGQAQPCPAIKTKGGFDCIARDRSGRLSEFEPMDLSALIAKASQ